MVKRMDNLETQEKEQQRLDAEEEWRTNQSKIAALPDPDFPADDLMPQHILPKPEDPTGAELELDEEGDLPEGVQPPAPLGNYPPTSPKPSYPQPVAISLNKE
jgi:hypothetical protein